MGVIAVPSELSSSLRRGAALETEPEDASLMIGCAYVGGHWPESDAFASDTQFSSKRSLLAACPIQPLEGRQRH